MDLIHCFLNIVAPPLTFFTLCLFLPPYYLFKSFLCLFHSLFSHDVSNKVVLITGASSGIGEQMAYEYAKRGARLALVARRDKSLREVAYIAQELGSPDVFMIVADVQKVNDCRRIIDETVGHFGILDHLVNNAGISSVSLLEEATDITNFRTVMDTNFWGAAYTTQFAIPYLRKSKGKIIALSSSASWLPKPRMTIYNASKAAMVIFFETLRVELGSDVDVLIVTPGFIESEVTQGKHLLPKGRVEVDQDLKDVQASSMPVESASRYAKRIVRSACGGDKYVTEPRWLRMTWIWKVFAPDVVELWYGLFYPM